MTAIVGLVQDGKVYIGADSAGISGWTLSIRADAKVFVNGPFVMGFTDSFRMGQLLRHAFSPPPRVEGVDDAQFMATTFIDAVRECLKTGGFAQIENSQETAGTFLVGYRGHLYEIGADYSVGESADEFICAGAARDVAAGALYVSRSLPPEKRIIAALEAAEHLSAAVRGPFRVEREP